jgi:hypothetical protein
MGRTRAIVAVMSDDPELLAPSVRHTRPRSRDYADSDHRLIERR